MYSLSVWNMVMVLRVRAMYRVIIRKVSLPPKPYCPVPPPPLSPFHSFLLPVDNLTGLQFVLSVCLLCKWTITCISSYTSSFPYVKYSILDIFFTLGSIDFWQVARVVQQERNSLFNKCARTTRYSWGKEKLTLLFTIPYHYLLPHTNISLKWIVDLI